MTGEQLQLDLNRACRRLSDQLKDRRRLATAGPERLLAANHGPSTFTSCEGLNSRWSTPND